ncbi:MAG: hypothetical protein J6P38_00840 [Acetobacter sp.]|nr:hypothetical protein [Acetobacter sp.]MBQ5470374.1 hypothetical protein [Acetobacter sp.]MBQ5515875.1 hypothetical protein [Acetobacter sp.]
MKKTFLLVLSLYLVVSLAACSDNNNASLLGCHYSSKNGIGCRGGE